MSSKALIIPAAGSGKRMKRSIPKPFITLKGLSILEHTLKCFLPVQGLEQIIVAANVLYVDETTNILDRCIGKKVGWQIVEGGTRRQQSIHQALKKVKNVNLVIVHDAVRPFVASDQILACCEQAEKYGAAVIGVPVQDTIKKVDTDQFVEETTERKVLWKAQTPQVFQSEIIKKAYKAAAKKNYKATDDASLVEWMGKPVKMVAGDPTNIKITYSRDLMLAKLLLKDKSCEA